MNKKKSRFKTQLLLTILTGACLVSIALVAACVAARHFTDKKLLNARANAVFAQLHDAAEQAILSNKTDLLANTAMALAGRNAVNNIQLYMRAWLLFSLVEPHKMDGVIYDFDITSVDPVDFTGGVRHTEIPDREDKVIGTLRIVLAAGFFQRNEVLFGFLLLLLVLALLVTAYYFGVQLFKCTIARPLDDIHAALNRLDESDLETPVPQACDHEIGRIQQALEEVRIELLKSKQQAQQSDERELAHLENQLKSLKDRNEVARAKALHVGGIASQVLQDLPDIKNVLTEALKLSEGLEPSARRWLTLANKAADEVAERLRDLVSLADSSILEMRVTCAPIDVADLLNSVIMGCSFPATRRKVELTHTTRPEKNGESATLYSDAFKIEYIVTTLLSYAIFRSDRGSIHVVSAIHDGTWKLTIVDTHSTLKKSDLHTVLSMPDPLTPMDLDLSAALLLIQRLGGNVTVLNHDDSAWVKLTLPAQHKESSPAGVLPQQL